MEGIKLTKKKKSFKISDFRIVFVFIVLFASFLFLSVYLQSDKFYCSTNPDKCVCEIVDENSRAEISDIKNCENYRDYTLRKKTQAELDIEDCNNNPREDDLCKCVLKIGCEHWLQLLNYDCSDWNTFNCSYWKEDVTLGYNYCINFISECVKSIPKTECEKGNHDYVEETIIIRKGCNEFGCINGNQDWDIEKSTIQDNPVTIVEVIKNETICREKQ